MTNERFSNLMPADQEVIREAALEQAREEVRAEQARAKAGQKADEARAKAERRARRAVDLATVTTKEGTHYRLSVAGKFTTFKDEKQAKQAYDTAFNRRVADGMAGRL